ncbi:MAG: hypothetical protein K0R65_1464 [Crocinitomicaceae bacterium]|jgi:hypothetical protein|nr:hypothetical protein [Crocinitomicaceae bacterium]
MATTQKNKQQDDRSSKSSKQGQGSQGLDKKRDDDKMGSKRS